MTMPDAFWFSPVHPARTDIAQYSARIVPHLSALLDLQVVHPGEADGDMSGEGGLRMGQVTMRDLNASRLSLFNIGNNPVFHTQILRTAMRHPGVVILHDRVLQDLCYAALAGPIADETGQGGGSCAEDAADSYTAAMARWYGRRGREAARSVLAGDAPLLAVAGEFPLFEVALQGALGAVTHNSEVAAQITGRFPGMPVVTLPLPYDPVRPSPRDVPGPSADRPIRLMMFGYLNPNRRLCEFLEVWALSPCRDRFELDIVGEMNNGPAVSAVIARTGLAGQVRNHGFLPDEQLDALIGQAHLVFNLRNPTMGEASGSQLRIWANGAASVVSDTGWYGQLPQGSALRVSTQDEQRELAGLLEDLAAGRIDLAGVARKGRESLAASDPATYAAALAQWLEDTRETMFTRWTETQLIEATARTYARCTPPRFVPPLPERLLA